jgi:tRNA(Ile)-lysidine synthase
MPAPRRVAVATSGGADSTALLHCTLRMARALGIEVVALHVHHGLMPQADDWQRQVAGQARRWGAAFATARAQGAPAAGDSVEAWARRVRYPLLADLARDQGCPLVLLAHHRRDQAETFLIQALRGGGAAGLASMPRTMQRHGVAWARPWLDQSRTAIERYVKVHRLAFVHDPSNDDLRYARGRLRRRLWPVLHEAFSDAETTLARAAARAADDAAVLAEVMQADVHTLVAADGALDVRAWHSLSAPRRILVLRAWLGDVLPEPVPETLVRRLAEELPRCRHAEWPAGVGRVLLRRGRLLAELGDRQAPVGEADKI